MVRGNQNSSHGFHHVPYHVPAFAPLPPTYASSIHNMVLVFLPPLKLLYPRSPGTTYFLNHIGIFSVQHLLLIFHSGLKSSLNSSFLVPSPLWALCSPLPFLISPLFQSFEFRISACPAVHSQS